MTEIGFPVCRMRRLRADKNLRRMVSETRLSIDDLVMPFFVRPGENIKNPISSMRGNFQLSIDNLLEEVEEVKELGIPAIILFGIPEEKDEKASGAYAKDGIIQLATKEIKENVPDIIVITDVCLCEYMSHGHCGIVERNANNRYLIDNDATLEFLAKTALSQVDAGADMVAPSAMMDGQVKAIREILDRNGYSSTPIMAYSAKFCSSFYGPFRDAAESPPQFGDRKTYQMNPKNSEEAIRETKLDIDEGADIVMVKPALPYLDIIYRVKNKFGIPVAAYNVSGEFSMVKAAGEKGWLDEKRTILEILFCIKRAGADIILTYFAKQIAKYLKKDSIT